MAHETEVIDSTHNATATDMTSSGRRSPLYQDTTPDPQTRRVRFHNSAAFSDTSNQLQRRVRFGIGVDGQVTWLDWYEYTSPEPGRDFLPECEVVVPQDGQMQHHYNITTEYELQQRAGAGWATIKSDRIGPYTATVNEDSIVG